jgi:small subunit ribosomal protein S4
MARYTGPSCRQCRREGTKLFLKGTKCFTEKCPVERRPYAPGQHGQATARRRKASEYAKQLREKQKIKRIYGLSERQFRNTFERVSSLPGITGHNLLASLESRLDNVVYRMGFAASRKAARQLIRHRHVDVGGRLVDIPSFVVDPGVEVKVRLGSREHQGVVASLEQAARGATLNWIAVDRETFTGRMLERPTRPNIPIAAQEQLVVELYSK